MAGDWLPCWYLQLLLSVCSHNPFLLTKSALTWLCWSAEAPISASCSILPCTYAAHSEASALRPFFPYVATSLQVCISPLGLHNKHHRLGRLNNRNLFFHNFGGQKSSIKVWEGLVSSEDSGMQMAIYCCVLAGPCFMCTNPWCLSVCPKVLLL